MVKKWKSSSREFLEDYRIFKTYKVCRESAITGKKGNFFQVEPPEWAMIIPLLKDSDGEDCFLMVRQYRHGSDSITLEFPAGMVDPGEKPFDAAIRELTEETGYKAGKVYEIGCINPNPAFMTNSVTTFLATDLTETGIQSLDEHEEIETILVPVKEFDKLIGGPEVNSAITLQAYLFYLRSLSPDIFNLRERS